MSILEILEKYTHVKGSNEKIMQITRRENVTGYNGFALYWNALYLYLVLFPPLTTLFEGSDSLGSKLSGIHSIIVCTNDPNA